MSKQPGVYALPTILRKKQQINNEEPEQPHPFSQSFLRTTSNIKLNHLLETFESLLKKVVKENIPLDVRDQQPLIDLPEADNIDSREPEISDDTLCEWLTEVCSKVFSVAFNFYVKDELNYKQAKVFCSEGILRNVVLLTKKFKLNKKQMQAIDVHIKDGLVEYMQAKYPLTESGDINMALEKVVKETDTIEGLANDYLQNSAIIFEYRESGNYNELIMKFLNEIMTSINARSAPIKGIK